MITFALILLNVHITHEQYHKPRSRSKAQCSGAAAYLSTVHSGHSLSGDFKHEATVFSEQLSKRLFLIVNKVEINSVQKHTNCLSASLNLWLTQPSMSFTKASELQRASAWRTPSIRWCLSLPPASHQVILDCSILNSKMLVSLSHQAHVISYMSDIC